MKEPIVIRCPEFDEVMTFDNSSNIVNCYDRRAYGHPIDEKIINRLNSPAVNAALRPIVEVTADYFQGQVIAPAIPVNEKSFPEINEIVEDCVAKLGIKRPYVVVESSTGLNAYTVGSDDEPFIVIGATLIKVTTTQQLKFIIGHECGHIAMGHVMYHTLASYATTLTELIPIIGKALNTAAGLLLNAWSRRSEITADRAGFLCCGDVEVAKRSLLQIEAGFADVKDIDITTYLENSRRFRKRSFLRRVGEYTANHPMLSKRIEALDMFASSQKYYRTVGKTPTPDAIPDAKLESDIEQLLKVM